MIIAITGTPGTGKSTFSKLLSEKLDYTLLDVNEFIKDHSDVVEGFDEERDAKIIDVELLNSYVQKYIDENNVVNLVIDSHLSHYFSRDYIDLVVIMKCDISVLKARLLERGYHEEKIKENIECEIFENFLTEAREMTHNVFQIETTTELTYNTGINDLLKHIQVFLD